jgi:hypothetical protein
MPPLIAFLLVSLSSGSWLDSLSNTRVREDRRLEISVTDPLTDWDGLTKDYLSLQQAIGAADQSLVGGLGDPGPGFPRFGEMLVVGWANLAIGHYSHELGHDLSSDYWGEPYSRRLDLSTWWPMPWPAYERSVPYAVKENQLIWDYGNDVSAPAWRRFFYEDQWRATSGINVEEWEARLLFERSGDGIAWDDALAFSFRKLSAATYQVYTGEVFGSFQGVGTSDPHQYWLNLRENGIKAGISDWYMPAILSDALTLRLWESLWMDFQFLNGGPRVQRPFRWDLGGGWSVTPPLVQVAYTPTGAYNEILLPVSAPGGWNLALAMGRDADWMGAGELNTSRMGLEAELPAMGTSTISLRPDLGGAMTMDRKPMKLRGGTASSGLEFRWGSQEIDLKARWSKNDLEQNAVHHRDNGWDLRSSYALHL